MKEMRDARNFQFGAFVAIIVAALLIEFFACTTQAQAATKKKSKTMSLSTVYVQADKKAAASASSDYAQCVSAVYRAGGLAGISAKKRNNINTVISRWEFSRILKNLYDQKINVAANWIDGTTLNQSWACGMLTETSKQLGVTLKWKGGLRKPK